MEYGNTRQARRLLWVAAYINVALLLILCCSASAGATGPVLTLLLALAVDISIGVYAFRQGLLFELVQERTWKAVCGGIGFVGEGRSIALDGVYGAYVKGKTRVIYPKLRDVHGTFESWTGVVIPFAGQTVDDYTKEAPAFALAFQVPFVTFGHTGYGSISIRAGQVPVPAAHDHTGHQRYAVPSQAATRRLDPPLPYEPLATERALLQNIPMAQDLEGRTWHMPVEGQHILIAARTGGGKGSWIWSLVLGLAPAWRVGLVKFWGCDPKRLELAIGRDWWEHYAETEMGIVEMLEACVESMFERASTLQGKARKFTPSTETPLNVIVVDELGYLSALLPDKKLRERAEKAVATILALGRAVGYSLVGAVQDPRKETVGFRDLFPIRIAGGLPAPMVDLVLGEGSHDAGAFCEQIPLGNAGAGVGYVISETNLQPLCVRAAWCGDDIIRQVLAQELVQKTANAYEQCGTPEQSQTAYRLGYGPVANESSDYS